jgi:hypothetical protein
MAGAKNTIMPNDEAVRAAKVQRSRLVHECAKLDKREEQALAEEGCADLAPPW